MQPAAARVAGSARPPVGDVPTRERLLDAAERLFGDHGLDGVSLRAVMTAAGTNPAAVHYHFGSKEGLVEAAVLRRLHRIVTRRSELLHEAGERPEARRVVEAVVRSLVEMMDADGPAGSAYLRFLAGLFAERSSPLVDVIVAHVGPHLDELMSSLAAALPELPDDVLAVRSALALETIFRSVARRDVERPWLPSATAVGPERFVAELVSFVSAGLTAPVDTVATNVAGSAR